MKSEIKKYLKEQFDIDERVIEIAAASEIEISGVFDKIHQIREYNQIKVIKAMIKR